MSDRVRYEPFYDSCLVRVPFEKFAWSTVSLPFFAFLFCVVWSVAFDFTQANFTHCQVFNFLPSISAAIGSFRPQRDVWQWSIAIQALPRLFVVYSYVDFYRETLRPMAFLVSNLACAFSLIENISLVGVSFWTSADNYELHKMCFITFVLMSLIHMMMACTLLTWHSRKNLKSLKEKALKWKWRLFLVNISSFFIAAYFFYRHNTYCEPKVYSLFAFFEYMVVLSNMAFHMTAYWDFYGRDVGVSKLGFVLSKDLQ